jgi:hypothetical protein
MDKLKKNKNNCPNYFLFSSLLDRTGGSVLKMHHQRERFKKA